MGLGVRGFFGFYGRHEVLAPAAAVTSAAVSVAFAPLPAEAAFSLAVPVSGVLPEPPLADEVLSDGFGLAVSDGDGDGEGEGVVVLWLVVGAGVDESIVGPDDADLVSYGVAVGLHDGDGLADFDLEECGDGEP